MLSLNKNSKRLRAVTEAREEVEYVKLHPAEFLSRLQSFPAAYVPLGSLEWHGEHLPFGVDTIRAEAILKEVALRFGGITVPGIPWGKMDSVWRSGTHPGLSDEVRDSFYSEVIQGLVEVGFKIIVGLSGHWKSKQILSFRAGIERMSSTKGTLGFAVFDGTDPDYGLAEAGLEMDHAGAAETSAFMYLYPELVKLERLARADLSDLPGEDCVLTVSGVQGENPNKASQVRGKEHVDSVVEIIGKRTLELMSQVTGNLHVS